MLFLRRILLFLLSLSIFASVIYFIEPPKSWPEASIFQILVFFIPLILSYSTFVNLLVQYFPHSFILGLGLLILTVLYTTSSLNLLSAPLTLALTLIAIKIFPKLRFPKFRLTKNHKIPKLSRFNSRRRIK